jgi:hypothetical protein
MLTDISDRRSDSSSGYSENACLTAIINMYIKIDSVVAIMRGFYSYVTDLETDLNEISVIKEYVRNKNKREGECLSRYVEIVFKNRIDWKTGSYKSIRNGDRELFDFCLTKIDPDNDYWKMVFRHAASFSHGDINTALYIIDLCVSKGIRMFNCWAIDPIIKNRLKELEIQYNK